MATCFETLWEYELGFAAGLLLAGSGTAATTPAQPAVQIDRLLGVQVFRSA